MANEMIGRRGLAGIAVAALGAVAGCGAATSSGLSVGGHNEPLHPGPVTAVQIGAADTAFGFDLFDKLCRAAPNANLTLSPASAAQALGMLDAGASGPTRAALGRLLRLPAWNPALVAALHNQTAALAKISQVTVTNHLFEQVGLRPTQATLDDLKTAYNTELRQLDFTKEPAATNAINAVVSKDTDHLIPSLFDQPLDPTTHTVLADAILLDAKWQQPFTDSSPGAFHTAGGGSVSTPLMDNDQATFASRTANGWQSAVLPYVGGHLQAVAMLPPASGPACVTPSAATLTSLTGGTSTGAAVVLPKLTVSQTLPLTQVLASMGLPIMGDYTGLGAQDDQITEVVQKVVMKVDEKGTKAAAATGVGVAASAVRVPPPTLTFNRPFLLVLEDSATHTPLFVARVANPTQQ
jgi:serpin B